MLNSSEKELSAHLTNFGFDFSTGIFFYKVLNFRPDDNDLHRRTAYCYPFRVQKRIFLQRLLPSKREFSVVKRSVKIEDRGVSDGNVHETHDPLAAILITAGLASAATERSTKNNRQLKRPKIT